jgi:hypothetical protein
MTQKIVEITDVEGKTLVEMVEASLPVSPRIVFSGRDSNGNEKNGEIMLDDFLALKSRQARYEYMAHTGMEAAGFRPYMQDLEEIHYLQRRMLDLRNAGFGKDEDVIVISGRYIPLDKKGTRILLPLANDQDKIGFRTIDPAKIHLGNDHAHIQEQLHAFVSSYIQHKP